MAITLLATAFDPLQALLMSLMVNARHLFYGVSMLGKYRGMGAAKFPLIYTLSDETFSIVSSVEPPGGRAPEGLLSGGVAAELRLLGRRFRAGRGGGPVHHL